MSRRARAFFVLMSSTVFLWTWASQEESPPPPGVEMETFHGGVVIRATLPGHLMSYALPRGLDGRRHVVLLVGPSGEAAENELSAEGDPSTQNDPPEEAAGEASHEPVRLIRLDPSGQGALEVLQDDLPGDAPGLAAVDLDGDGADELILSRPGALDLLREGEGHPFAMAPEVLVSDPDLGRPHLNSLRALEPTGETLRWLCLTVVGALNCYGALEDGSGYGLTARVALPIQTLREAWAMTLRTPAVRLVGSRPEGGRVFAAGPEAHGKQRLRTLIIQPDATEESRSVECWSRLPGPEAVIESDFMMLDGRPALAVTTRIAEKLSLFGEKRLRLFRLEPDRTRTGRSPLLAVESRMNLWQGARIAPFDVNGDGRQDLVVVYWKGLKKDRVVLDVYLRKEDGSFAPSPQTTAFDVKEGNRSFLEYGPDLNGDGVPDLLLMAGGKVRVYPGRPDSHRGRDLVSPEPLRSSAPAEGTDEGYVAVSISAGGFSSYTASGFFPPRVVDLDGDGRPEVVLAHRASGDPSLFLVIQFSPAGSP